MQVEEFAQLYKLITRKVVIVGRGNRELESNLGQCEWWVGKWPFPTYKENIWES